MHFFEWKCLNQWWPSLLTHICVTRTQWINTYWAAGYRHLSPSSEKTPATCTYGNNTRNVGQRKKVTAVTFFPTRPRPDQRGTNTGQIRKVPVYEITRFLVYRMGETRSQMGANNEILVCLVREIWQFKLFAGKEVTAVPATRGEGGYWRRGRRLLCLCWNWIALSFLKHWK